MAQTRDYATKRCRDNEGCDPFWKMEDIKNVVEWFEKKNDWDNYLITLLELLLGRRIGDTISMKWSDFYYKDGAYKTEINSVQEQKTGKTIVLALSSMVFDALEKYATNKHIDPIKHYNEDIFTHPSKEKWYKVDRTYFATGRCELELKDIYEWVDYFGKDWSINRINEILDGFENQKTKKSKRFGSYDNLFDYIHYVVDYKDMKKWHTDNYRSKLKQAVKDCNIKYRVSTHTMRKSFCYWIYTTHMFDPNCVHSLQKMFGHVNELQTLDYMCVTKMRNKKYLEDHGEFIRNVLAGKGDEIVKNMPVISLKSDDFGKIIRMLTDDVDKYQKAIDMANELRVM